MKNQLLRFTLSAIIIYLTGGTLTPAVAATQPSGGNGTHFCGVIDSQWDKRYSDQYPNRRYARSTTANLDVGEPRTVRMIYFLPNDWQYRADVVQKMKDTIRTVQTFYAEQMGAHGYGGITFRFETDSQGEPMVHRVDGDHPFSYYDNTRGTAVFNELGQAFDLHANIYFIVLGTDALRQGNGQLVGGVGHQFTKNGGVLLVPNEFSSNLVAHELGHTFALNHDFRDGAYIMSYGPGRNQLSVCAAEFLSVHSYFNSDTPIEEEQLPTIELISPRRYSAGSQSARVRIQVSDSDGLHQVLLHAVGALQLCRKLTGEKDAIVEFEYDGSFGLGGFMSFSSDVVHAFRVDIVDTDGNVNITSFVLAIKAPYHIATLEGHTDAVRSVSFSLDGTLASGSEDGTVKLWDVATRQNTTTLEGHTSWVESVSFSPDGTLASGSGDGTVKLWDVVTQQDIATLKGHTERITSVSFSSDDATLATGSWDGTVKLWDVETERDIATFRHTEEVTSVSFSSDGAILATGSRDRTVKLWDVATRQNIATLEGHTYAVTSVSFSSDGAILATGSRDRTVKLWDVATRQNIATLEGHTYAVISVAFSLDGTLASGGEDGTVKLWDVATGGNFATLPHTGAVRSMSFSPDGRTLASGTTADTVELWDMSRLMEGRLEALTEVDIPDPNLRAAIATALGKPSSAPIVRGNMSTLTRLEARNANISDLTGLEGATSLRTLDLRGNSVSDFSPLTGLTKLRSLYLGDSNISDISTMSGLTSLTVLNLGNNSVSDISAVAGLTKLTTLSLWSNSISDISAIAGLTNLTRLSLWDNNVSDISAISGLTNLRTLNLGGNSILDISAVAGLTDLSLWNNSVSDISAVSGLTNLTSLNLGGNSVSDISAVAGLTDLTELNVHNNAISDVSPLLGLNLTGTSWDSTGLYLERNPLSYVSINTHIPAIQAKGVEIKFDNRAHPALLKISGDNQKGAAFAPLSQPFLVEAQDENGFALVGISVMFAVTRGDGTLGVTSTTTDANGRAQSTLILGPNLGANTVEVSAAGIESPATFYAIADSELPPMRADVNHDGLVNVLDLIVIASSLGQSGQHDGDVNGDRVVSILDLVLAAGVFEETAAAPSAQPQVPETLTAVEVHGWLTNARSLEPKDPIMKRGFAVLEQLLVSLTPKETELLANYPNPFNPETWIPYRLAEDAFVTLTIYDGSGRVVRTLNVGHRIAAVYENRSKAIYWNGRNGLGEQVASGVYFYHLSAGDYFATRKMVILK